MCKRHMNTSAPHRDARRDQPGVLEVHEREQALRLGPARLGHDGELPLQVGEDAHQGARREDARPVLPTALGRSHCEVWFEETLRGPSWQQGVKVTGL